MWFYFLNTEFIWLLFKQIFKNMNEHEMCFKQLQCLKGFS